MPTETDLQRTVDALRRELEARAAELAEARAERVATAEILEIINASTADLTPVFDAILQKAHELCRIAHGSLQLWDGECIYAVAVHGMSEQFFNIQRQRRPIAETPAVQALLRGERYFQIDDARESTFAAPRRSADIDGTRTILGVPLRKDGRLLGVIFTTRREVKPFTEREISLLESFAAQASIAIENARLFNETREALARQTATADVLKVISRSAFDLKPVFSTIVQTASRLCEAEFALIYKLHDDRYEIVAANNAAEAFVRHAADNPLPPGRGSLVGRTALERKPVHIPDCLADPEYSSMDYQAVGQYRTMLGVPLLRDGVPIGIIGLQRTVVRPFTEKQIELVATFADQAVIAIENARLFEEVTAKTREVEEALRFQTGSASILNIIASSPTDVQPVLKAIVESACELCGAYDAVALLKEGDYLLFSAHHGPIRMTFAKWPINRHWTAGRAFIDKTPVHVHDLLAEQQEFSDGLELAKSMGHRSIVSVPLLREGESIGALVLRRTEVNPFSEKQIALLQTFADQAVIALGNVHLFEEVQAKTHDLEEALRYQTGSANILNVIASSPTDVQPVLKAIVESACELCEAYDAVLVLKEGDDLRFSAHHGPIPLSQEKLPINRNWVTGRAVVDMVPIHIHDLLSFEGDQFPLTRERLQQEGHRTILSVPLLCEGESIGAIILRRTEVHPFSDKQIALLQTFADQAVIALGNVGLFQEVQAKTHEVEEALRYQTGSANILNVIASSPTDVQPVLKAIVESACELCGAYDAAVVLRDGEDLRFSAHHGPIPIGLEKWPINRRWTAGRAFLDCKPVHIEDLRDEKHADFSDGRELAWATEAS